MKFIGTDDAVRGDMTLLPLPTASSTRAHIERLGISEERPWILQQHIAGPEYCTHSLVVRGEVKAFVACPSAELLMHYEALPPDSVLSRSMQRFTQEFAAASGSDFTGHLSFDFLVNEKDLFDAASPESKALANHIVTLYPIECNPRAHTAVALFEDTPEMISKGYMSLLDDTTQKNHLKVIVDKTDVSTSINGATPSPPIVPYRPAKYYWIGHDLVELVLLPILSLLKVDGMSFVEVFDSLLKFLEHVIWWRDGTFEVWDPLPAWWLYHVYWPSQFLFALLGGWKWSRLNVSTCKMFGC